MAIDNIVDKLKPAGNFKIVDGSDTNYVSTVSGFGFQDVDSAINELARRTYTSQNDIKEPTGFIDLNAELSVVDATRIFTFHPLTGGSSFYIKGKKFTITTEKTITLSNSEGRHYVYFGDDGELHEITTFNVDTLLFNNAYVSYMIYNATDNVFTLRPALEMHGTMPSVTHRYLHENFGTRYNDGLTISNTVDAITPLDSDARISVTSGLISDEDLRITISQKLATDSMKVFYRSGVGNIRNITSTFPVIGKNDVTTTTRIKYNSVSGGSYALSELDNGKMMLTFIIATNSIQDPLIAWIGSQQYNNATDAYNNAYQEIDVIRSVIPLEEMVVIGALIVQTDSYTNTPNARFVSTPDGGNYIDLRQTRNSNYGSAVTQMHNNLLNRDSDQAHPATAVSLDTTTFNKNLNNTVTDVQLLAEAVDELNITGAIGQKVYYFTNLANNLSLSTIRTNLDTANSLVNPVYNNNDTSIAVNPSGNYYVYCIVPEGVATDRILYDAGGGSFTNIQSTFVGNILYNNISYGAYVSVNTAPLTTVAKTVRFVIYPNTLSYVESYTPTNREIPFNTGIRNRIGGSGIVVNSDGTLPSNKIQAGVPSISEIQVTSYNSSDYYYVNQQNSWNNVKGKRIVLTQLSDNSQWYLKLPTLAGGRFVQNGEFVQVYVKPHPSYTAATAVIDTFSTGETFDVGGYRISPLVGFVYQITYNGTRWAVTSFSYGASGNSVADVQTLPVVESYVYRDFTDKTLNVDGNFDVVQGTKLITDVPVTDTLTVTNPSASTLTLSFSNRFNMVQTLNKHLLIGDLNFPSYTIDQFYQTIRMTDAYEYVLDVVLNNNYASGAVDEPISDENYDITKITYLTDTTATLRIDSGTTPVNMIVGSVLTLTSNTGVNSFNNATPVTITGITNGAGFTDLSVTTTLPVISEGDGTTIIAFFARRLFTSTTGWSDFGNAWQVNFAYYLDPARTTLATIQDYWWQTGSFSLTWFSGLYVNQVDTNGDFSATGQISGGSYKFGNKTLSSTLNPSTNGDTIYYDSATDSWVIGQNAINGVVTPERKQYDVGNVDIGTGDSHTLTLSAFDTDYVVLDDFGGDTLSATTGLNTTYSEWQGGGIDGNDNWFVTRQYSFSGSDVVQAYASGTGNNTFTSAGSGLASFDSCSCTNGNTRFVLYRVLSGTYYFARIDTNGTSFYTSVGILTNAVVSAVAISNDLSKITLYIPSLRQYRVYSMTWNGNFSTASLLRTYTVPNGQDFRISQDNFVILDGELVYGVNSQGTLFSLDTNNGNYTAIETRFVNVDSGTSEIRMGIRFIGGEYNLIASGTDGSVSTINLSTSVINRYKSTTANQPYAVGFTSTGQPKLLALGSGAVSSVQLSFNPIARFTKPIRMESALPLLPDSNNSSGSAGMYLKKDSSNNLVWDVDDRIYGIGSSTALSWNQTKIITNQGSAITLTLPDPNSLPVNEMELTYTFTNNGTGTVTINTFGGNFNNGTNTSSYVLNSTQIIDIVIRRSAFGNKVLPKIPSAIGSMLGRNLSTSPSIPIATDTVIPFDTIDTRTTLYSGLTGIAYDPNTFTFTNVSGKTLAFTVNYMVAWTNNSSGFRYTWCRYNGNFSSRLGYDTRQSVNGDITVNQASFNMILNNNDYFNIVCYHTSSQPLAINPTTQGGLTGLGVNIAITRLT